jgi:hypothetical protein
MVYPMIRPAVIAPSDRKNRGDLGARRHHGFAGQRTVRDTAAMAARVAPPRPSGFQRPGSSGANSPPPLNETQLPASRACSTPGLA